MGRPVLVHVTTTRSPAEMATAMRTCEEAGEDRNQDDSIPEVRPVRGVLKGDLESCHRLCFCTGGAENSSDGVLVGGYGG